MTKNLELISTVVWGIPMLVLILGAGLYFSIRTGFAQLRFFPKALRSFFAQFSAKGKTSGQVSPFQALCTALAATVGTGNLAGVAGAMAIGGPGAIFWMWICAVLGMATKYAEATLAVRFRTKAPDGSFYGGPMHMVRNAMGKRWLWLGTLYSFLGVVAAFGVGNATQINAVVSGVNEALTAFQITPSPKGNLILGLILAVLVYGMLCGGAKRIGRIAEMLVPFVSAGYLLLGLGVLIGRYQRIPQALSAIVVGAFSPEAVTGGMIGSAVLALRIGVSRGVFTNEAGMGTAAIAHGAAQVAHPADQGLMGIMEVFWDTVVICTVTALVILVSGVPIPYGVDVGAVLTTQAFCAIYGGWVSVFLAGALCCFAFATVLGWGLYGARCAQFLFGADVWRKFAVLQAVTVLLGAVLKTGTVWILSEIMNGLMAIPNLIILLALSPELVRLTKEYQKNEAHTGACGGTYESFHQRKPLRALSYAEIPSAGGEGTESGKNHLPFEHR